MKSCSLSGYCASSFPFSAVLEDEDKDKNQDCHPDDDSHCHEATLCLLFVLVLLDFSSSELLKFNLDFFELKHVFLCSLRNRCDSILG